MSYIITMNFKQFLLLEYSKPIDNEIDLVYQRILDNLDDGHFDALDDKIMFNVGIIIKDSAYNNLHFVIRKAKENKVRLGKGKDGKPAIVVDAKKRKLPSRKNIDTFLEDVELAKQIKEELKKYLELYFDGDAEVDASTNYEKKKGFNSGFEDHLTKLIAAIDKKINNFHEAKSFINNRHSGTANVAKQEQLAAAKKALLDDEFGGTFNNFKSIVLKLPEAEFVNHLESEAKKKVLSRLESYYEHKAHNFTEE